MNFKLLFSCLFAALISCCSTAYTQQRNVATFDGQTPKTTKIAKKARTLSTKAQKKASDFERCNTMEADKDLRTQFPELGTLNDFEQWLAPKVKAYKENAENRNMPIHTIPVIFHVIHNGEAIGNGSNIGNNFLTAQLQQLNDDFRKIAGTCGDSNLSAAADTEVEFCLATIDPNGNPLGEPGVHRVNRNAAGFSAPPFPRNYVNSTIKPATSWNPNQYMNVWVLDLQTYLGYAQFPSQSGLPGLSINGGAANTDGVVVRYASVGSCTTPFPGAAPYNLGRTLTHEVGHWLGLRHIWGDGGCGVDDFCADTPASDMENYGCSTGHVSCGTVDMIENYMDYTDDNCMNTFTNDQKARIKAVIASSPRRDFSNSPACQATNGNPCENPIVLNCGVPYQGSLATASNDWSSYNCSEYDELGNDVLHTFTTCVDGDVTITVSNADSTYGIWAYLLDACDPENCLANRGDGVPFTVTNLPAGTYYVVVEHYANTPDYELLVNCPDAGCDNPFEITCGEVFHGNSRCAENDFENYSCSSYNETGADIVHEITICNPGDIRVTAGPAGIWAYVLDACNPNRCLGNYGDGQSFDVTSLHPGTYYIVIEDYLGVGSYSLEIDCPDADCANAIPVECGQTYSGSMDCAYNDVEDYACSTYLESGAELVHSFTTTETSDIEIGVSSTSTSNFWLYLLSDACSSGDCLGNGATVSIDSLPAGTYYIVVEEYNGTGGAYDLTIDCLSGFYACDNPLQVVCEQPITFYNTAGANNFESYGGFANYWTGPEIVHEIAFENDSEVKFNLFNLTADLDLLLIDPCNPENLIAYSSSTGEERIYIENLPAGVYHIVVDGWMGAIGSYELTFSCADSFEGTLVDTRTNGIATNSTRLLGMKKEVTNIKIPVISYPNPAIDRVTIEMTMPQTAQVMLRVYDFTGKTVAVQQFAAEKGLNQTTVEVSNLPKGVYQITLESEGLVIPTQRIVVQ